MRNQNNREYDSNRIWDFQFAWFYKYPNLAQLISGEFCWYFFMFVFHVVFVLSFLSVYYFMCFGLSLAKKTFRCLLVILSIQFSRNLWFYSGLCIKFLQGPNNALKSSLCLKLVNKCFVFQFLAVRNYLLWEWIVLIWIGIFLIVCKALVDCPYLWSTWKWLHYSFSQSNLSY